MRVLVTGGAGFIGSHLVDALCSAGNTVRVLDDLSSGFLESVPPGVELIRGSVADETMVAATVDHTRADIAAARRNLGHAPRAASPEGLRRTFEFYAAEKTRSAV